MMYYVSFSLLNHSVRMWVIMGNKEKEMGRTRYLLSSIILIPECEDCKLGLLNQAILGISTLYG